MRKEVILVALEDRYGTSRLPALLHRAGCCVTLLGPSRSMIGRSRFVDYKVECSTAPSQVSSAIKALLVKYNNPKPWIILCDERALGAVAVWRGQDWLDDVFPVKHRSSALDLITHKSHFMVGAAAAGISVPRTKIAGSIVDVKIAARDIGFPLFLKADIGHAGWNVKFVANESQLADAYTRMASPASLLVQHAVTGMLGKTDVLYNHGKPICWAHCRALKTYPGEFGPSCVREYMTDSRLDALVAPIGKLTGFHGLCGFDWIIDSSTNEAVVIEFNGRVTPAFHLASHCGVDFAQGIAGMLAGKFSGVDRPVRNSPPIHMFPQDLERCIEERDMKGLLKWMTGRARNDIPWNDLGLLTFHGRELLGRLRGWLGKRLFRRGRAISRISLMPQLEKRVDPKHDAIPAEPA